jgi:hypothetical protein
MSVFRGSVWVYLGGVYECNLNYTGSVFRYPSAAVECNLDYTGSVFWVTLGVFLGLHWECLGVTLGVVLGCQGVCHWGVYLGVCYAAYLGGYLGRGIWVLHLMKFRPWRLRGGERGGGVDYGYVQEKERFSRGDFSRGVSNSSQPFRWSQRVIWLFWCLQVSHSQTS